MSLRQRRMKLSGAVSEYHCEKDLETDLSSFIYEQTKLILASLVFGDLEHPKDEQ